MADNRKQNAKKSKGICNRLKKAMGLGSRSTPQSRPNSPSVVGLRSTPQSRPNSPSAVGSQSTPQSRSNLPSAVGSRSTPQNRPDSPSAVDAPPVVTPAVTVDLEEAAKLRAKYTRFRILVIGRANAGKTTLLKRVCNTTEEPSIYDKGKNLVSYPTYRDIPLIISSSTARSDLEGAILMISAPLDLMTDFNTVAGNPRCSSFIHFQEQPRVHLPWFSWIRGWRWGGARGCDDFHSGEIEGQGSWWSNPCHLVCFLSPSLIWLRRQCA